MKEKDELTEFKYQSALFFGVALFVLCYSLGQYIRPFYIIGNYVQNGFLVVLMIYFLAVIGSGYRDGYFKIGTVANFALLGMTVGGFISCMMNNHKEITIYGDEFQGAGLITLCSYYVLYVATSLITRKKYREILLHFMVIFFTVTCVFGLLQFFKVPHIIANWVVDAAHYPTRNQNAFAVFTVFLYCISFAMLLYKTENKKLRICMWIVNGIAGATSLASVSSLVYVAVIMVFLLAFFLEIVTKQRRFKILLSLFLEFCFVFFIFNLVSEGGIFREFLSTLIGIKEADSLLDDSVGNFRMAIWKSGVKDLKEYGLWGCGIELLCLKFTANGLLGESYEAHNGYLHIWLEQGLLSIICYMVFLFALYIPGMLQFFKNKWYKGDAVSKVMLFAFFGFIAQDFFNINMMQVGPYFWPICGLLFIPRNKETVTEEKESLTKEAE